MTEKDKRLLVIDLSGRVSFDTIVKAGNSDVYLRSVDTFGDTIEVVDYVQDKYRVEEVKPYLRPMSSMTGEEWREYNINLQIIENTARFSITCY